MLIMCDYFIDVADVVKKQCSTRHPQKCNVFKTGIHKVTFKKTITCFFYSMQFHECDQHMDQTILINCFNAASMSLLVLPLRMFEINLFITTST